MLLDKRIVKWFIATIIFHWSTETFSACHVFTNALLHLDCHFFVCFVFVNLPSSIDIIRHTSLWNSSSSLLTGESVITFGQPHHKWTPFSEWFLKVYHKTLCLFPYHWTISTMKVRTWFNLPPSSTYWLSFVRPQYRSAEWQNYVVHSEFFKCENAIQTKTIIIYKVIEPFTEKM